MTALFLYIFGYPPAYNVLLLGYVFALFWFCMCMLYLHEALKYRKLCFEARKGWKDSIDDHQNAVNLLKEAQKVIELQTEAKKEATVPQSTRKGRSLGLR